jgi:hypothetical protein
VEQALAELTVFPNPSKELLHVRLQQSKSAPAQLYLYNAVGQLVYSQAVETEYTKLDVIDVGLIPGVYTVHVQTGQKHLVRKWVLSY